ncbi:hypothetical protein [Nocardioides panzhihuensis]|uniref:Uncharacterized protein n=1 Tax=Nocardioides panzhihuensis TaxID=860243 RepID=A0A7Z0IS01_9ACTN|nr:hypothetical protein [Nocardioides panzhihuensis]NYI77242.1 hypothetical protein [Nocardioides panzhihuensis]
MTTTLWDRSVMGASSPQPLTDADTNGTEPTRPEHAHLLASAESQAITMGELFAWVGLAVWGGALVAFMICDLARTYRHHHEVSSTSGAGEPGVTATPEDGRRDRFELD